MEILSASLKNFRNLAQTNIELYPSVNIFYGDNGQGKTNFLESLYFCATGRSHRTHNDKELINFGESDSYIQLQYKNNDIKDKISVHIKKDSKKGIAINGLPVKKLGDLLGNLLIVMFSPEDLNLVKNGPSERRKFLDMEICQLSAIYYHELNNYYRALKQRNNLLKEAYKNKSLLDTIFIWDEQLVTHGSKIYEMRKKFVEEINEISANIYAEISEKQEELSLIYKPNILPENFGDKLNKNLERDLIFGSTSSGIHKDDIAIFIDGYDIRSFGSQGQQRTASLSMKLAEIDLIDRTKNKKPVLLLDDVLSELDEGRQRYLLSYISTIQTVITCTGVEDIIRKIGGKDAKIFKVEKGIIYDES
ncbi:DNA replication/repair protein RecF [Tyzzerella sp. OttesenSCG-928-J15]|nr:DNA replication/repair protein RecF [Tyzzerella sp. OttesenSCG-928-J15]MDL2248443.1 DNA replication/repair protein RecF [Tyzzerella sp. OttesenSCG-928-J15]